MIRYVKAERAREIRRDLGLKSVIVASMAGANQPTKHGHAPRSLKTAIKMLKKDEEMAKGDF